MSKIILVSNRLPVEIDFSSPQHDLKPTAGGLATSLQKILKTYSESVWIGYPGDLSELEDRTKIKILNKLITRKLIPVELDNETHKKYYEDYSNKLIWPLFHYLIETIPLKISGWSEYQKANQKFADKIIEYFEPGDLVWIQDYHLFLVPAYLRKALSDVKIGFFLHIPFPSSEIFRILPNREDILEGLLGADLVGFHTYSYQRNFTSSVMRLLGLEYQPEGFYFKGNYSRAGVFPISIDLEDFQDKAIKPEIIEKVKAIKTEKLKIILGIDRMDYTKGIPRRLLSIERFFEKYPQYIGKVKFIQVGVPTRSGVDSYVRYRRLVFELVGRINGKYSNPDFVPIHFIHRSVSKEELIALYKSADIMLVTPIRDGMNLVAKEYVICKGKQEGILILSEYAGAVSELQEALVVNPFHIEEVSDSIRQGLEMDSSEKIERMTTMYERIEKYDMNHWGKSFLDNLNSQPSRKKSLRIFLKAEILFERIRQNIKSKLIILSDFDGTLVGFKKNPAQVGIDSDLSSLLEALKKNKRIEMHILSGRPSSYLQKIFPDNWIRLHSDHGLFSRDSNGEWITNYGLDLSWKEELKELLIGFSDLTPGSFVEDKQASLVWHYRNSEIEISSQQLREIKIHFLQMFSNRPVSMIQGNKAIEFRMQGISKANIVGKLLNHKTAEETILSMGDDHSDGEIFSNYESKITFVAVGDMILNCDYRVHDYNEIRNLLKLISEI
jgi:trehalose 6-phosphate synthase/phosphatase